jgi:hypothetical protein
MQADSEPRTSGGIECTTVDCESSFHSHIAPAYSRRTVQVSWVASEYYELVIINALE